MLGATHLLAGSIIYQKVNNRFLAYGLAFGSHYLLDRIPHYELKATTNYFLLTGTGLGVGLRAWKQKDWGILIAGLLSIFPDINWKLDLIPSLNYLHCNFHTRDTSPEYVLLLELIVDALIFNYLVKSGRSVKDTFSDPTCKIQ